MYTHDNLQMYMYRCNYLKKGKENTIALNNIYE